MQEVGPVPGTGTRSDASGIRSWSRATATVFWTSGANSSTPMASRGSTRWTGGRHIESSRITEATSDRRASANRVFWLMS